MIYTANDINLASLTPKEFERLCYELLLKYGFNELTWRQGGADSGRDIEGWLFFSNHITQKKTKWFFECKHYISGGVPPADLTSKIAWADAEQPDFLIFFISSYLTKDARLWLDKIRQQRKYDIIVIEGEELKIRMAKFDDLVEQFFSSTTIEQLFIDVKKHWLQYQIEPSYEAIREIVDKINPDKFTLNDLGFIFFSFYRNYIPFEKRDAYYGDFTEQILEPLYDRLFSLSSDKLELFEPYRSNFDVLRGSGILDEIENIEWDIEPNLTYSFQYYELHLNYKSESKTWARGCYLFLKTSYEEAVELFMLDGADFPTASRVYNEYSPEVLSHLAIDLSKEEIKGILLHCPTFNEVRLKNIY